MIQEKRDVLLVRLSIRIDSSFEEEEPTLILFIVLSTRDDTSALILLLQRTTDNYDANVLFLLFKCNDANEALLFSTRVDWNQKK